MSKISKYISVFFIWIAWLVITAHLVIPHDHHLSDSCNSKENSCPVSSENKGHSTGLPVHCHALNDLTSGKATACFSFEIFRVKNIAVRSSFDPFAFDLKIIGFTINSFSESLTSSKLQELSSLRAPPSLI
jgi:hypothetical protein